MNIDIKVSERISCEKGKRCGSDDKKKTVFFSLFKLKTLQDIWQWQITNRPP